MGNFSLLFPSPSPLIDAQEAGVMFIDSDNDFPKPLSYSRRREPWRDCSINVVSWRGWMGCPEHCFDPSPPHSQPQECRWDHWRCDIRTNGEEGICFPPSPQTCHRRSLRFALASSVQETGGRMAWWCPEPQEASGCSGIAVPSFHLHKLRLAEEISFKAQPLMIPPGDLKPGAATNTQLGQSLMTASSRKISIWL